MNSLQSDHGALANTAPWQRSWPSDQLEYVSACPVCECRERVKGHESLVDNVFYCAPGRWDSWRCVRCGAYYLDPRPTPESIHGAYQTYFTHQSVDTKVAYGALSGLRRLRRRLVNAYTNWRFSTREEPSDKIGVALLWLLRAQRRRLEWDYRHLPRMPAGGRVLLDVGCGNGSFLNIARSCGWLAVGVDPDPIACVRARGQGFEVHQGGIEYFDNQFNLFHVITMNHVIEHVHDPVSR